MTHDPMCPNGDPRVQAAVAEAMQSIGAELSGWCQYCPVIARVREDERDNCWGAVAELVPSEFWEGLPDRAAQWWIVKADALAAIEALGGER